VIIPLEERLSLMATLILANLLSSRRMCSSISLYLLVSRCISLYVVGCLCNCVCVIVSGWFLSSDFLSH
jgi:hypothetical protein